jgi:hypothetical protein
MLRAHFNVIIHSPHWSAQQLEPLSNGPVTFLQVAANKEWREETSIGRNFELWRVRSAFAGTRDSVGVDVIGLERPAQHQWIPVEDLMVERSVV